MSHTTMQASKTFLEMHVDSFANMPRDTLILQGLLSLKASLQSGELDASNCTVAVVGKDQVMPSGNSSCVLLSTFNTAFGSLSRFLTALPFNHSSTLWMRRKWRFFFLLASSAVFFSLTFATEGCCRTCNGAVIKEVLCHCIAIDLGVLHGVAFQ